RGGAGLAETRIALERVSQVRAVWRMVALVLNQIPLQRKGYARGVFLEACQVRANACGAEPLRVIGIGAQQCVEQRPKLCELVLFNRAAGWEKRHASKDYGATSILSTRRGLP